MTKDKLAHAMAKARVRTTAGTVIGSLRDVVLLPEGDHRATQRWTAYVDSVHAVLPADAARSEAQRAAHELHQLVTERERRIGTSARTRTERWDYALDRVLYGAGS